MDPHASAWPCESPTSRLVGHYRQAKRHCRGCLRLYIYMHTYSSCITCLSMCVCLRPHAYMAACILCICVYLYVGILAYTHTYVYVHMACVYKYMNISMNLNSKAYIDIYTYSYLHTIMMYIHWYTHECYCLHMQHIVLSVALSVANAVCRDPKPRVLAESLKILPTSHFTPGCLLCAAREDNHIECVAFFSDSQVLGHESEH